MVVVVKRVLKRLFLDRPVLLGALLSFLVGAGTALIRKPGFEGLLTYTGGAAILLSGPFLVAACGVFLPFRRWRRTGLAWVGTAFLLFAAGLLLNLAGLVLKDLKGNF